MSADNTKIDVRMELKHLPAMLQIAVANELPPKAYIVHEDYGLILLWNEASIHVKETEFPSQLLPPIPLEDFVVGWMKTVKPEHFKTKDHEDKEYRDSDVSNGKGFRMYNEQWGHVAHCHYAFVAIKPVYMWYGK